SVEVTVVLLSLFRCVVYHTKGRGRCTVGSEGFSAPQGELTAHLLCGGAVPHRQAPFTRNLRTWGRRHTPQRHRKTGVAFRGGQGEPQQPRDLTHPVHHRRGADAYACVGVSAFFTLHETEHDCRERVQVLPGSVDGRVRGTAAPPAVRGAATLCGCGCDAHVSSMPITHLAQQRKPPGCARNPKMGGAATGGLRVRWWLSDLLDDLIHQVLDVGVIRAVIPEEPVETPQRVQVSFTHVGVDDCRPLLRGGVDRIKPLTLPGFLRTPGGLFGLFLNLGGGQVGTVEPA